MQTPDIGYEFTTKDGLKAKVISNKYDVEFEDGYIKRSCLNKVTEGDVSHPLWTIDGQNRRRIYNVKGKRESSINHKVFYNCECLKCKQKMILDAESFLAHAKKCM